MLKWKRNPHPTPNLEKERLNPMGGETSAVGNGRPFWSITFKVIVFEEFRV